MENPSSVKEVLISIGYSPKERGKDFACRPLYRDSNNDGVLSVNRETGLWYDFKEGYGGNLQKLIEITLNIPAAEAFSKLKGFSFSEIREEESPAIEQLRIWPNECLSKLKQDHRYWHGRGVPETVISQFKGGIAEEGRMYFRYVFPIFNDRHQIIGFAGRDLINSANRPKWKIIGPKKHFSYPSFINSDELREIGEVFIVESIGDMLSLWTHGIRNVLVTFGLSIHNEVLKKLIQSFPNKIFIALNKDENFAGQTAAGKMKEQLSDYFDEDKIQIVFPEKNDFNSMDSSEFELWKKKLKNYQHQE